MLCFVRQVETIGAAFATEGNFHGSLAIQQRSLLTWPLTTLERQYAQYRAILPSFSLTNQLACGKEKRSSRAEVRWELKDPSREG